MKSAYPNLNIFSWKSVSKNKPPFQSIFNKFHIFIVNCFFLIFSKRLNITLISAKKYMRFYRPITLSSTENIHVPRALLSHFSHVQLFSTLWTLAHQTPLSMGFSSQDYWNGLLTSGESSWLKDWTHVSYVSFIGRWVLYQ